MLQVGQDHLFGFTEYLGESGFVNCGVAVDEGDTELAGADGRSPVNRATRTFHFDYGLVQTVEHGFVVDCLELFLKLGDFALAGLSFDLFVLNLKAQVGRERGGVEGWLARGEGKLLVRSLSPLPEGFEDLFR